MPRKVLGIDFGSSQSVVSCMEIGSAGRPELLKLQGTHLMPTRLLLDSNDGALVAYGHDVCGHLKNNGDGGSRFFSDFKPDFGLKDEETNACRIFLGILADEVRKRIGDSALSEADFMTCLGYPAVWKREQIDRLKEYAEEVGFPDVRMLPEPVAAINALRIEEDIKLKFGDKPEHYLVVDFGGGTLDVCVVGTDVLGRNPKILSTGGDERLGGRDFDEIIRKQFIKQNDIDETEFSGNEKAELRTEIQRAKENFSKNFTKGEHFVASINLRKGKYDVTLTRERLESIFRDQGIYKKIEDAVQKSLDDAVVPKEKITRCILSGGSSGWFFMRTICAKMFGIGGEDIYTSENPCTDVARGCAVAWGFADTIQAKPGLWVRCKIGDGKNWGPPKLVFKQGRTRVSSEDVREVSSEDARVFLGVIKGTRYSRACPIVIQFATKADTPVDTDFKTECRYDHWARENLPFLEKLRNVVKVIKGLPTEKLNDIYKVFITFKENTIGGPIATICIRAENEEIKETVVRLAGGQYSFREWFGFAKMKSVELEVGSNGK
jgi:hypothetical protein